MRSPRTSLKTSEYNDIIETRDWYMAKSNEAYTKLNKARETIAALEVVIADLKATVMS